MLEAIKALPYPITHDIFTRGCMLELKHHFDRYNSDLKMALRSLMIILCHHCDTVKNTYILVCYIKYKLGIPLGCLPTEFPEYLPILELLQYNVDYTFNDLLEAARGSTATAINRTCDIINSFDEHAQWNITFVDRYQSKEEVMKSIVTVITTEVNHLPEISQDSEDVTCMEEMINYLYDELQVGGYGREQYLPFLEYMTSVIFLQSDYGMDHLLQSVADVKLEELVNVLLLIVGFENV